jgi:hypothetical protein
MVRTHLAITLAALPFLFAAAPAPVPAGCPNTIRHEPLVLYDVSGSTIAGPIDTSLVVYNDGTVRVSSTGQFGLPSTSQVAFVGFDPVHQLLLDLSSLGAGQLCDDITLAVDLPTSTLTVFRDASDSRNHTFSWIVPIAPYDAVQQRLQDFIHTHFPSF